MTDTDDQATFGDAVCMLTAGAASAAGGYTLKMSDTVRAGVKLAESELSIRLQRGRDGRVAEMNGGEITLLPPEGALRVAEQRELSFYIRLRDPSGTWNGDLVREFDEDRHVRFMLSSSTSAIFFVLYTDFRPEPLRIEVPLALIGSESWHDIVGRYVGHRVELFADGALADEDWPVGSLRGRGGRIVVGGGPDPRMETRGFHGEVDDVAIWDRGLTDAEVESLCGGASAIAGRGWEYDPVDHVQYGEAPDGGFVGDCFPFYHDGVFHFYYLLDRRNHRSKFHLGAHQWAHASSSDLTHWVHHPVAIPITDEREGSICTGSVLYHDGTWYGFYATRMLDRSEHLSIATSSDGIHFEKMLPNPVASPKHPYRNGPFRDPHVFQDPKTGQFHMLVTAELESPEFSGRGGCLAHLVSTDLRAWQQEEPFLITGYGDQPECSELFEWHGLYYLVFSHFGVAHYRISRSLFGPWERPKVDTLDGALARVMKSASFTGDRRIGTFFLDKGKGYAGCAVFREYVANPDGTLGTKWPAEMVPPTGSVLRLLGQGEGDGVEASPTRAAITKPQGFSAVSYGGIPHDFLLRCQVTAEAGTQCYGIGIRGKQNFREALNLEFEPSRRKVGWRTTTTPSWRECEVSSVYEVDGLEEALHLEVIAIGDVLDVCVNGLRTLINRQQTGDGDRLFLYCQNGRVTFDHIQVRTVLSRSQG